MTLILGHLLRRGKSDDASLIAHGAVVVPEPENGGRKDTLPAQGRSGEFSWQPLPMKYFPSSGVKAVPIGELEFRGVLLGFVRIMTTRGGTGDAQQGKRDRCPRHLTNAPAGKPAGCLLFAGALVTTRGTRGFVSDWPNGQAEEFAIEFAGGAEQGDFHAVVNEHQGSLGRDVLPGTHSNLLILRVLDFTVRVHIGVRSAGLLL